jgi:hypothetical protein
VPGCVDDSRCQVDGGAGGACCGGQCTDTRSDPNNCGACGMVCATANANSSCVGGQCKVGTCKPGWGDCNGNPIDGCETNQHSDANNCTACGKAC